MSNQFLSFGGEDLNNDLDPVKSARKLPRFTFSQDGSGGRGAGAGDTERSTSSGEESHGINGKNHRSRDKAVDSNKAIVTAYYVKKLL